MNTEGRWRCSVCAWSLAFALQAPLAEGQVTPSFAGNLIDIVGDWDQPSEVLGGGGVGQMHEEPMDRGPGPLLGDYGGLPINDALRYKAQTYSPDWLTVPEHQCIPHPSTYQDRSPGGLSLVKLYDPVTQNLEAYLVTGNFGLPRTIWMDGRPHPGPNARHTYEGFSTGRWQGDVLVVETTHLKAGWVRRNGVAHSDEARMVQNYVRHEGHLTVTSAVFDPLYYDEPLVRSVDYKANLYATSQLFHFGGFVNRGPGGTYYKCAPIDELDVEVGRIPHYLPGQNPELEAFASTFNIPLAAAFGGTETMYPEYMAKLRQMGGYRAGQAVTPPSPPVPAKSVTDMSVTSEHVKGQVWMVTAGEQNVAVQIGEEGILVVDPGRQELAAGVLAEIRRIGGNKPVRQIIQTSSDLSRIGAGAVIGAPRVPGGQRPNVIAHESVGLRLGRAKASGDIIPNDTFFRGSRALVFNNEAIEVIHVPSAHTDGDVIVFFRGSDVVVTGAVVANRTYPDIDLENGGSLQGTIDALNRILAITVAEFRSQGGTMVIAGQGHLYDEGDVAEYRDMVTILRDRIRDALSNGKTLDEVQAARLTRDYDGRYGVRSGAGSTDAFVAAAYRSLKSSPL